VAGYDNERLDSIKCVEFPDQLNSPFLVCVEAFIRSRIFCLPVSYKKNLKFKVYKTVILPVVPYGCEAWSFREEQTLRVFEDRVLRRIFGPKSDEDRWRKLHNDELHNLYSSPNIVRVTKLRKMR
jgi:hypothetical protein